MSPVPTATGAKDLVALSEILDRLTIDGKTLRRFVREGRFPKPDLHLTFKRMWWRRSVWEAWLTEHLSRQAAPAGEVVRVAS